MSLHVEIAALAEELCDAHVHIERVRVWDKQRNAKWRVHRATLPGLLAQLYEAATEPVGRPGEVFSPQKPGSRPPLAVAALSRYFDIAATAQRWVRRLDLAIRTTPESNIRAVVGYLGRMPTEVAEEFLADLKGWRRTCAVMTGWKAAVFSPSITCPECETEDAILVNPEVEIAFCKSCSVGWEGEGQIRELANRVGIAA